MKISIICAFNSNKNTGMYTVDRAINIFLEDRKGHEISYFSVGQISKFDSGENDDSVKYYDLFDNIESCIRADMILFWGDFLCSKIYWEYDLIPRLIADGVCSSETEASDKIYKTLMLEKYDASVLQKVVIYGCTLLPDSSSEISDDRYRNSLERMIKHAAGVFFRDAYSNSRFSYLRSGQSMFGTDCALINSWKNLENNIDRILENKGPVGIYYGRSGRWERFRFISLVKAAAKNLKREINWIQWFPVSRGDRRVIFATGAKGELNYCGPEQILEQLASCSMVITDVYHMAVNSWAMGIPAFLIGHGNSMDFNTVGSKKKEVLMNQMIAQRFYLFWEDLGLVFNKKKAAYVAEEFSDKKSIKYILNTILNQSKNGTDLLNGSIKKLENS